MNEDQLQFSYDELYDFITEFFLPLVDEITHSGIEKTTHDEILGMAFDSALEQWKENEKNLEEGGIQQ
mgnify:CR=1 FL=1